MTEELEGRHTAGWNTIFFSYLLTWEVDLIEIIPQMWQYVIFLSLKPTNVTLDFMLNYRIYANSFHGNYAFLNLALCTVTFGDST